jgi:hypothetical protein
MENRGDGSGNCKVWRWYRMRYVKNTDEWVPKLTDPYWIKVRNDLVEGGLPEFIATPAVVKMEREDGMNLAYGVFAHTPKNADVPEWVCESEVN